MQLGSSSGMRCPRAIEDIVLTSYCHGVHRLAQEADAKVRSIETEQLLAGAAGSSTEALQVVNEELHVPPATAVGQRTQGLPFVSE